MFTINKPSFSGYNIPSYITLGLGARFLFLFGLGCGSSVSASSKEKNIRNFNLSVIGIVTRSN